MKWGPTLYTVETRRGRRPWVLYAVFVLLLWLLASSMEYWVVRQTVEPTPVPRRNLVPERTQAQVARIPVTVTAYSSHPAETDSDPHVAACGPVRPGTLAVSEDLWERTGCGKRVVLDGREYVVWDRMHPRWRRRVDVWMPSRGAALRHGVRRGVLEIAEE